MALRDLNEALRERRVLESVLDLDGCWCKSGIRINSLNSVHRMGMAI